MRRFSTILAIGISLIAFTLMLGSCDNSIESAISYPTPTIKGSVSIPASAGLSSSNVWVKVVNGDTTKYVGKVNSDGTFVVSGLDASLTYDVLLTSIEPEQANYSSKEVAAKETATNGYGVLLSDVSALQDSGNDIGSVKIKPLGTIKGTVVRSGATDNYDVIVYIPGTSYIAMTDKDGNFSIYNVPQGTQSLRYTSNGYVSQMLEGVILASSDDTVSPVSTAETMTLVQNEGILSGKAVLDSAVDSAGITIKLERQDALGAAEGSTSSDGSYSIPNVAPGTYNVLFSYPGFTTQSIPSVIIQASKTTLMEEVTMLGDCGTIKGSVLLKGQDSHEGIVILIENTGKTNSYTTTTNASGSFLKTVKPDSYTITASCSGFISTTTTCDVYKNTETPVTLPELVSRYGTISGNAGVSGILIVATNSASTYSQYSGENGVYQISNMVPGSYSVSYSLDGYVTQNKNDIVVVEGTNTKIADVLLISSTGLISGKLNIANAQISLCETGKVVVVESVVSGSDGSYVFDSVNPGTYDITISKNGYVTQKKTGITVFNGKDTNLDSVTMIASTGTISGKVVLSGTTDFSSALVTAVSSTNNTIYYTATTIADGSYIIYGVNPGEYVITLSKDGYVSASSKIATVSYGEISVIDSVTLANTAVTLTGKVTLDGASSHIGIQILLKNKDSSRQYDATTDAAGSYIINSVVPDVYTVLASKDGYSSKETAQFTVEPSVDKTVDTMNLAVAVRSITGNVTLELKEDYAGALITATNIGSSSTIYSAITNSAGNYTLAGMIPGEYQVVLSNTGYRTVTLPTVSIVANTTKDMGTTNLQIARGYITGYVKLEGRTDHSGTIVTLVGTSSTSTTGSDGSYSFNVPSGNYPGGVSFSKEDFETEADTNTITVLTDTTYAVTKTYTLEATAIPVVKGVVDVRGTDDDSKVTVSIKGTSFSCITDSTGTFSFSHVPANATYSVQCSRENAATVVIPLTTAPSAEIDLGTITLTPQSSSIEGTVTLDSVSTYGDVKVSVATEGESGALETTTDASGYFYIGDLLSNGKHTITFSRTGWNSVVRSLDDLTPLEVRDITSKTPVTLTDTTVPVLSSVTINSGSTATSNAKVTIDLVASDAGSGLAFMRTTWLDDFAASSWVPYYQSFDSTIPVATNETKTIKVQVKDNAGNTSTIVSDDIPLIGQVNTKSGVLSSDADLHWVDDNDTPYLITGDVIIPQEQTLVIDPGVQVYFTGNYSISARGTLYAVGTEAKPIRFESVKDNIAGQSYTGDWGGIVCADTSGLYNVDVENYQFTYNDGCTLQYCVINDLSTGISGTAYVANCTIASTSYAIGNVTTGLFGILDRNVIHGSVKLDGKYELYSYVFGNKFYCNDNTSGQQIFQSDIYYQEMINNYINGYQRVELCVCYCTDVSQNSIINCGLIDFSKNSSSPDKPFNITGNSIEGLATPWILDESDSISWGAQFNNILTSEVSPVIKMISGYSSTYNWPYNYWGTEHTQELTNIANGYGKYPSFILDGSTPGYTDKAILEYAPYATSAWNFAGYQGDEYVDINAELVRPNPNYNEPYYGKPVSFTITEASKNAVSQCRIAQTVSDLLVADWVSYTGNLAIDSIDTSNVKDGYASVFIQGKSAEGIETPIHQVKFAYDLPQVTYCSLSEGKEITNYNDQTISVKLYDGTINTNAVYSCLYLDGVFIGASFSGTSEHTIATIPYTSLKNGDHIVSIVLKDGVGNIAPSYDVHFTVNRTLPSVSDFSVVAGTVVGEGENLPVSFQVTNASHVKQVCVKTESNTMYTKSFNDGDNSTQSIETEISSVYLPNGSHSVYAEVTDYAGNVVKSEPVSFSVSGTAVPPVLTVTGLDEGFVYSDDGNQTVVVDASDAGGVKDVWMYLGDERFDSFAYQTYNPSTLTRQETFTLPLGYRKNGKYVVKIQAEDFAGNTVTVQRNITINRTLPNATLSITDNSDSYTIDFSSGNQSYCIEYLNGVESGNSYSGWQNSIAKSDLPAGDNTLQFLVVDQAGNETWTEKKTLSVARTVDTSLFGKGTTWNEKGNLLKDWYTSLLWTFEDSSNPGKEESQGLLTGNAQTTEGGIGNAASIGIDKDFSFSSPRWTLEFWGKGYLSINVNKLINLWGLQSSNDSKYMYYQYYLTTVGSSELTSNSMNIWQKSGQSDWHYYSIVSTGTEIRFYRDGLMVQKVSNLSLSKKSDHISIGTDSGSLIDEIRLSGTARSVDEIWQYYQYAKDYLK
jgi:hypothetical protein